MPAEETEMRKSCERASEYRSAGNKLYCERDFFEALLKYNESLCFAMEGSEAVGLAYANRSAVYFEMKLYEKCIRNIELAKLSGYPPKNVHILEKRQQKCEELMGSGVSDGQQLLENPFDFVRLSYKENPRLPFVVECLEMRQNDTFGRYIVTTRDLNVGDILAIEEPHFKVIKSDSRYDSCAELNKYQRCSVCLRDNLMDLIPCSTCTSTMYCSVECLQHAEKNFHNYECAIIEILLRTGIMQMAMRMFFQSLNMFNGSVKDLQKFLANSTNKSTCVYDFDFSEIDQSTRAKNFLLSAYNLARNENVSIDESASVCHLFMLDPRLTKMWETHSAFISDFIARIIQLYDSNFHGICGWSMKKFENNEPQMIGVGCYTFASLINHSCAPNINRSYVYDKMAVVVDRPIKKGEQLFDCYRTPFFRQSKSERQASLISEYSFHCRCEACTQNYSLFHALKSFDKKLLKWAKRSKTDVLKLNKTEAKKKFVEYCATIQDLHAKGYPSAEIVLLQECLQQCISLIIKPEALFS